MRAPPVADGKRLAGRARYRAARFPVSPREVLHSAWRYSVFVAVMKAMLPVAALGIAAAVVSYAMNTRDPGSPVLTVETLGRIDNDLAMLNPKLSGADEDGMPFTVTAASAVPESRGSERILLEDVDATLALKSGGALHVTAMDGIADTKDQLLDLSGGIHLTTDDGYDVRTPSARADWKAGAIRGDEPIIASGRLGRVTADRFFVDKGRGQVRFTGNVHTVLNGVPAQKGRKGS